MREDPIIQSDWQPGVANNLFLSNILRIDMIFSLTISFLMVIMGILEKQGIIIFTFVFLGFGLFLLEYVIDQYGRDFYNRIAVMVIFMALTVFLSEFILFSNYYIIFVIIGSLFMLKLSLIPIILSSIKISGEILIPKSTKVLDKLQHQIKLLAITEYAIDPNEFLSIRKKFVNYQLTPFIIGFIVIVSFLFFEAIFPVFHYLWVALGLVFLIGSGISFSFIILLWNYDKKQNQKIVNSKT